jgi:hypothetical protein
MRDGELFFHQDALGPEIYGAEQTGDAVNIEPKAARPTGGVWAGRRAAVFGEQGSLRPRSK